MIYKTTRQADQDIIDIYVRGVAEFDPPVRLHPYQAHMIADIARDDEILIIRILHGRQEWERYLP